MSRQIKNIIAITFFLICIGLINVAGQNIEIEIRGMNAFTFILITAVLLQVIFFIPSFLLKTEKYYDLVGSLTYITTISLAYFSVENKTIIDSIAKPESHSAIPTIANTGSVSSSGDKIAIIAAHAVSDTQSACPIQYCKNQKKCLFAFSNRTSLPSFLTRLNK